MSISRTVWIGFGWLAFLLAGITAGAADDWSVRLRLAEPTSQDWAAAMVVLGDEEERTAVRDAVFETEVFPRKELVELLSHQSLAVRLGALGLLEEARGGDEGFLPFVAPGSEENAASLSRWLQWADSDAPIQEGATEEDLERQQRYLRELMSDDRDRAQRARRGLKRNGLQSVRLIEEFLQSIEGLPTGEKARLREAQFDIVLAESLGGRSAQVARDLVFGNRDQRLAALGQVREAGPLAIPICREYIDSEDALVRESALDSLLAVGREKVFGLVTDAIAKERDVNVLHGMVRRLKDIPGEETVTLLMPLMEHEDEDILTSVMSALSNLMGDDDMGSFGFSGRKAKGSPNKKLYEEKVVALLDDKRWRVRASALEAVGSLKPAESREKVGELLDDEDEFVSFRAIEAAVSLGGSDLQEQLKKVFLGSDDLIVPVLAGFSKLGKAPDQEMVAHLRTREPDLIVSGLAALESDKSGIVEVVASFTNDENLDVACAALRRLAKDDDIVTTDRIARVLVGALRSGSEEKKKAVLGNLDMPNNKPRGGLGGASRAFKSSQKTSLDSLYEAFLRTPAKIENADEEVLEDDETPRSALLNELAVIAKEATPEGFSAAIQLARVGDSRASKILLERLPGMSTAQRGEVADGMYYVTSKSLIPVFEKLLADPVEAIRAEVAELTMRDEKSLALVELPFNELDRKDTPLRAHQLANYGFSDISDTSAGKRFLGGWARSVLNDEDAPVSKKVLACYGLTTAWRSQDSALLEGLLDAESPWLRRAAWYALGRSDWFSFLSNVERLLDDESPQVREALPEALSRNDTIWLHAFSDTIRKRIYEYDSQRSRRTLNQVGEEALRKMAEEDGDARLRFEAYFALLSHQREIDLEDFVALFSEQPAKPAVADRLAEYFSDQKRRVGPGVKSLLAFANQEELSASDLAELEKRFGKEEDNNFLSFASLSQAVAVTGSQAAESVVGEEEAEGERESLPLVYFHKPGCKDCARVEELLASLQKDFPMLTVEKHSIMETQATVLNQALCLRFGVPARQQTLTPAVFAQAGALIKEEITANQLGGLLEDAMALSEDSSWKEVNEADLLAAEEKIDERFAALTLPVIVGAGLLDGINPCAFATIIFFLSYLQVAKRSAREILMIGAAFISAVFLTYFAVGIALHGLIEQIARFKGAQVVMTWVFAAFALVVAILSFRDGLKARKKGGIQEMSLQLPSFLKDRIRLVIRKGAKARNFVIAAFASGVVISLLELACTGQVYAPIIFKIQQGDFDAVGYLAIYNVAFITPLVIIFGLAFGGMRSDTLIAFQSKHTAAVKFGLAALFFALFLILVFQDRIL